MELFYRSSVWLEVDISHPTLIDEWISGNDLGLKYSATFNDFTRRLVSNTLLKESEVNVEQKYSFFSSHTADLQKRLIHLTNHNVDS